MSRSRESEETRPRDVPGFREAAEAGLLPVVPPHPPRVLPGRTADQEFWVFVAKIFLAGAGWWVVGEVVTRLSFLPDWAGWVMLPLGLAMMWGWTRWIRPVGDRKLAELTHGYTTLTLVFGAFRRYPYRRHSYGGESRLPWDYRGVWVLGSDGRVKSAPDHAVEPPGFFPSPNRPGAWELWTGAAWSSQFRQ